MENVVERRIMWGDLDSLGIVFYPRYYEWIDACGHLFFEAVDLSLHDLWRKRGIQFGLVETSCRYHRPGRYHQQVRIHTRIAELKKKTLLLSHEIRCASDGNLVAEGFEKRICMDASDPSNLRAVSIPEEVYAVLKQAQEE